MGMFDYIEINVPLPDSFDASRLSFQTKDLANQLEVYRIDHDRRLIKECCLYETVPEEERPNYGTPAWDGPLGKSRGCIRPTDQHDEFQDFTGEIEVYGSNACSVSPDGYVTSDDSPITVRGYTVWFEHGIVQKILLTESTNGEYNVDFPQISQEKSRGLSRQHIEREADCEAEAFPSVTDLG
jgi:hypothetical protein